MQNLVEDANNPIFSKINDGYLRNVKLCKNIFDFLTIGILSFSLFTKSKNGVTPIIMIIITS